MLLSFLTRRYWSEKTTEAAICPLPASNAYDSTADCHLPTTDSPSQTARCPLPAANSDDATADCRLPTANSQSSPRPDNGSQLELLDRHLHLAACQSPITGLNSSITQETQETANCPYQTGSCPLPTGNYPSQTADCQLPTANCSFPTFSEEIFTHLLTIERKRTDRSRRPFALMLIDASEPLQSPRRAKFLEQVELASSLSTRETDLWGWYEDGAVIGVLLTEIGSTDLTVLRKTMLSKLTSALRAHLDPDHFNQIHFSFHTYPHDVGSGSDGDSADTQLRLYPDLQRKNFADKTAQVVKRLIDIVGSLAALMFFSPAFLASAVVIKLTSKGPVLFKQERVGQYGKRFTFLKFRSMYFKNDPKIHEDYVKRLIAGQSGLKQTDGNGGVYKLKDDPRITPVGRFLRKTSLDEFPQFINVLRGDMSLVGPRPPIPYEVEAYDIWHRRRYFEVKPGITGMWQVMGRSKLKFDDMVRLDLRYTRDWSLGLDLRILLRTPWVVLFGKDAV